MGLAPWFFGLAGFIVVTDGSALAEESASDSVAGAGAHETTNVEVEGTLGDDWFESVWRDVDDMVRQESLELQETVTAAGVRGDEAEGDLLDQLHYVDEVPRPTEQVLNQVIHALKKALVGAERLELGQDSVAVITPTLAALAQRQLYIARCYEELGERDSARVYYSTVASREAALVIAAEATAGLERLASQSSAPDSTQ